MKHALWMVEEASAISPEEFASLEARIFGSASWGRDSVIEGLQASAAKALIVRRRIDAALGGFAMWRTLGAEAEVLSLGVTPPCRGAGASDALLSSMLENATALGLTAMFLEVGVSNRPALALYERHGFAPVGERRRYYRDGENALVLKRAL